MIGDSLILYLNTSHVLIYLPDNVQAALIEKFKYISCSYLSSANIVPATIKSDLNTSHVLIYQGW